MYGNGVVTVVNPTTTGNSVAVSAYSGVPNYGYPGASTYTIDNSEPVPAPTVVSERTVTRDELAASGNLVEASQQTVQCPREVSPLMAAIGLGGSVKMTSIGGMPMTMGGSVQVRPGGSFTAAPMVLRQG